MKYPTMRFVFDRKKVATKKKKGLVQIEVQSERKRKWIGTNVKVFADQWDDRQKVINTLDSYELNDMLDEQMRALNGFVVGLMKSGQTFDFNKLDAFLHKRTFSASFIDFVEKRIEERTDIEESTRKQHRTLLRSLGDFGIIKLMDDLTRGNIILYDEFLHSQGIGQSTVYNYHKRLKRYISEAIRFGLLDKHPYVGLSFSRGTAERRRYLTEDELASLRSCEIGNEAMERVRDVFLFQCYTGMAYADLEKFDFSRDAVERGGRWVVLDKRQKTEEDFYIVLLAPAVEILQRYDFRLPVISNQKYNAMLKVLAMYARIDKPITSHVARHTFAVFALNNGVSMEVLARMMGHTNIRTTQIYAKVVNREVERGFDLIEERLRGL